VVAAVERLTVDRVIARVLVLESLAQKNAIALNAKTTNVIQSTPITNIQRCHKNFEAPII